MESCQGAKEPRRDSEGGHRMCQDGCPSELELLAPVYSLHSRALPRADRPGMAPDTCSEWVESLRSETECRMVGDGACRIAKWCRLTAQGHVSGDNQGAVALTKRGDVESANHALLM